MPLIMKKTINGQPVKIRLTADTGSGNPVGTILPLYKKSNPIGYLYCDGSTFDQTVYPALYAYLGTNVLPDYREFALVGAEENTTDVYNASTNPNGTIHDHDVYTEEQAKDDQVQDHAHHATIYYTGNDWTTWSSNTAARANDVLYDTSTGTMISGRKGTVTRGKRKAVYFYIKATSGLSENAQDNVINTLNEQRSYSTTEHNTGKKWIDGKPIYSRTFICTTSLYFGTANQWIDCSPYFSGIDSAFVSKIDVLVNSVVYLNRATPFYFLITSMTGNTIMLNAQTTGWTVDATIGGCITLEYTKTTD